MTCSSALATTLYVFESWRVEKPGRVVVMDGASQTMLIRPDRVVRGGRPRPVNT